MGNNSHNSFDDLYGKYSLLVVVNTVMAEWTWITRLLKHRKYLKLIFFSGEKDSIFSFKVKRNERKRFTSKEDAAA